MESATHSQLVEAGCAWLKKTHPVVVSELATTGEEPDCLGWKNGFSTLVECKAARSDYLADKNKFFRLHSHDGVGHFRYYLTTPGIISEDEIPTCWGLLYWDGKKVSVVRTSSGYYEYNKQSEIGILLSTLRRVGVNCPKGVSIRVYTLETSNRASVHLSPPITETARAVDGLRS